jgi:hypothetical protein
MFLFSHIRAICPDHLILVDLIILIIIEKLQTGVIFGPRRKQMLANRKTENRRFPTKARMRINTTSQT